MKTKGHHQIVKRYAKAFFEVCQQRNQLEGAAKAARVLKDAFDKQVLGFFANPVVTETAKVELLQAVAQKASLSTEFLNLLLLLLSSGRILALRDILSSFLDLTDKEMGILRVEVVASRPLTGQDLGDFEAKVRDLTGKASVIESTVDASLVAGYVMKWGGVVIDCSLKNQLKIFKASLVQGV